MIARTGSIGVVTLVLVLAAACGSGAGPASPTSTTSATSGTETTEEPADFPTAAFAAISEDPVTEDLGAELQGALARHDVADGGGMSATVMTAEGTWSGTTGKADGVRDLQVNDQFAIASITKSVVAAQVMLMVEAGELGLDDLVADHLPEDLQFDTNKATIRHLLGHVIEHLRGRPLAAVLRDGALAIDGLNRLVYQPDERPTEPMAMPAGASNAVLETRGGYLPSLASATAYHASGAIASDSPSLARWWRAFCAGEIVSQASLTEMSAFKPADQLGPYGLGLYNPANGYAQAVGHTGQLPGYMSWAACLPDEEAVIVVLTNHEVEEGHLAYSHGLARPLVDALRSR